MEWLAVFVMAALLVIYVYYRSNIKLFAALDAEKARVVELKASLGEQRQETAENSLRVEEAREQVAKRDADLKIYVDAFANRTPPNCYNHWYFIGSDPGFHSERVLNDLRADKEWMIDAATFLSDIGKLSSDSRRALEEAARFGGEDTSATPLLKAARKLLASQPQALKGNVFDLTSPEILRIATWIDLVTSIGPYDYVQLLKLTQRLKEGRLADRADDETDEAY